MEGILLILLILVVIYAGRVIDAGSRRGGIIVKDNPASKKPKIGAAPQLFKRNKQRRNKYGRTKDEQELHEWLEDNPR